MLHHTIWGHAFHNTTPYRGMHMGNIEPLHTLKTSVFIYIFVMSNSSSHISRWLIYGKHIVAIYSFIQ